MIQYVNRLSDYLFVLMRQMNKEAGNKEKKLETIKQRKKHQKGQPKGVFFDKREDARARIIYKGEKGQKKRHNETPVKVVDKPKKG